MKNKILISFFAIINVTFCFNQNLKDFWVSESGVFFHFGEESVGNSLGIPTTTYVQKGRQLTISVDKQLMIRYKEINPGSFKGVSLRRSIKFKIKQISKDTLYIESCNNFSKAVLNKSSAYLFRVNDVNNLLVNSRVNVYIKSDSLYSFYSIKIADGIALNENKNSHQNEIRIEKKIIDDFLYKVQIELQNSYNKSYFQFSDSREVIKIELVVNNDTLFRISGDYESLPLEFQQLISTIR